MIDWIAHVNKSLNDVVWGPPMLILLVGTGVFLTFRTGFIQFYCGRVWAETLGRIRYRSQADGDVSPFQAMTIAMGGTVGVGNIAGVATAVAMGGPGAIFWMMMSGVVGMATKFAEATLGVHFRRRHPGEPMMGGPMMYIQRGLGPRWRWLAVLFCLFGALAAFGIGNMVQANAVAEGAAYFGVPRWVTGAILLVAVGLVTIGGVKRIAQVASVCVPFMCGMYLLAACAVILMRAGAIPAVIGLILEHAFTPAAAAGGFAGATMRAAMRYGLARGVFSNEAGLGSAPMAHATAAVDHPVKQGFWGVFEVFFDTIIVCFATGLVILLTGAWTSGETGATLTMTAFGSVFGKGPGAALVTCSMILTAYDTLLAWCFYGETCAAYLTGRGPVTRTAYRVLWLPFTLLGALGQLELIWNVADTLNGLMAIPNIIALLALNGVVVRLARGYFQNTPYEAPSDPA